MTTVFTYKSSHAPVQSLLHKSFEEPDPDTRRNAASVGRVVEEALTELVNSVNDRSLLGLRIRSVSMVETSLDWVGFTTSLQRMSKYLSESIKQFGKKEIRKVAGTPRIAKAEVDPVAIDVAFDFIDELAIAYGQQRAAMLIAQITADTRDVVRGMVVDSLRGNLTVDQLGRRLRDVIPLTPAAATAIDTYREKQFARLIEEGAGKVTLEEALSKSQMLADKLAARKLKQRTETIARTELAASANRGRYAGWEASVNAGAVKSNSLKEWSAADSACPQCAELDGMLAPWDGLFPNGLDMPPDHPACRCSAILLPPDDDIIAEMERQFSTSPEIADRRDSDVPQVQAR